MLADVIPNSGMTDPETRTAEERARDILYRYGINPNWGKSESFRFMTEQIQKAMDQARKEAQSVCDHHGVCDACMEKYQKQGFELMREMASNILVKDENRRLAMWSRLCELTNQIRALQPPREGAE